METKRKRSIGYSESGSAAFTNSFVLAVISIGLLASVEAQASLISQDFSGVQLNVVGEYIKGASVPIDQHEFAPSFQQGQTISGSITYETDQPDISPGTYGSYRIGTLSIEIPDIGLYASQSGTHITIADNTTNPDDQFVVSVVGVDSFSSNVGLPSPESMWVILFGSTSMFDNDLLPTSQIDWIFGNASFNFTASDDSRRQVLMTFSPIPEPATIVMFGLGSLIFLRKNRKKIVKDFS